VNFVRNRIIDVKAKITGKEVITFIPALYSHLKLKAALMPRDELLLNQLRATAVQLLKQKDIDPSRVETALSGTLAAAMIPSDDEVTTRDLLRSLPAKERQALMSGEGGAYTLWRWVGKLTAFAMILLCVPIVLWIVKYLLRRLNHVTIKGKWFDYWTSIITSRLFTPIMAAQ